MRARAPPPTSQRKIDIIFSLFSSYKFSHTKSRSTSTRSVHVDAHTHPANAFPFVQHAICPLTLWRARARRVFKLGGAPLLFCRTHIFAALTHLPLPVVFSFYFSPFRFSLLSPFAPLPRVSFSLEERALCVMYIFAYRNKHQKTVSSVRANMPPPKRAAEWARAAAAVGERRTTALATNADADAVAAAERRAAGDGEEEPNATAAIRGMRTVAKTISKCFFFSSALPQT